MGLDMYLYAESYLSSWHEGEPASRIFRSIAELVGARPTDESPHMLVQVCVAYWRKANAIHGWFVDNVQGGEDDCRPHHVDRDQLTALRDTAALALRTHEGGDLLEAGKLLTPREGFFFGPTELDEEYAEDLRRTVRQLEAILASGVVDGFIYRSSW